MSTSYMLANMFPYANTDGTIDLPKQVLVKLTPELLDLFRSDLALSRSYRTSGGLRYFRCITKNLPHRFNDLFSFFTSEEINEEALEIRRIIDQDAEDYDLVFPDTHPLIAKAVQFAQTNPSPLVLSPFYEIYIAGAVGICAEVEDPDTGCVSCLLETHNGFFVPF